MVSTSATLFGFSATGLARTQFGFTIAFHIIFPAITIGLASYLAVLEGFWLKTKQQVYKDLYHFWLKIFGVTFGMGVVSGLVMAYQFGTNWSGFSEFAGSVTGPLLTYEVLTAFFLEAGFLGVMMFGWNRVGAGLHFFSTLMVAIGTLVSMTWIIASNSWMQTPQGYEVVNHIAIPIDWFAIIFNPSFPYRLAHMGVAAFLATALFVGASAAWHLLRNKDNAAIRTMLSMAMWMVLLVAPLQVIIGDFHGLNTLKYQPEKIAAMEGHWENHAGEGVPMVLFAIPDMQQEKNNFSLEIPHGASLVLTHSWDGQIKGLKEFAPQDRPNATIIFWTFRIMVGLGMLMVLLGLWSGWLRYCKRMYESRLFLQVVTWMGPAGLLAILMGWFTTEIGRQPWVVYGVMRTADAASKHTVGTLAISLGLFIVVYVFVFGVGITYVLRLVRKGPTMHEGDIVSEGGPGHDQQQMRPMSLATDSVGRD